MLTIALSAVAALVGVVLGQSAMAIAQGRRHSLTTAISRLRRRRRLVRIHVERRLESQEGIVGETDMTLEGILLGRFAGMYVLTRARILGEEEATVSLVGDVEVPAERVIFVQNLGRDAG